MWPTKPIYFMNQGMTHLVWATIWKKNPAVYVCLNSLLIYEYWNYVENRI
jgi:hypothetical protein